MVCLSQAPGIREPLRAVVSGRNVAKTTSSSDREDEPTSDVDATASNLRDFADLATDRVDQKTPPCKTTMMKVKTADGREILVPVMADNVKSALQRHIQQKNATPSTLKLTDSQIEPDDDDDALGSDGVEPEAEQPLMAANQYEDEAVNQQVGGAGEMAANQHAGEAVNQQVALASQQVIVAHEAFNQQVDLDNQQVDLDSEQVSGASQIQVGEAGEEQLVLYTDDDMIQYVTSVDLSYYNQHQGTSQQQQQQQLRSTTYLSTFHLLHTQRFF